MKFWCDFWNTTEFAVVFRIEVIFVASSVELTYWDEISLNVLMFEGSSIVCALKSFVQFHMLIRNTNENWLNQYLKSA